MKDRKTYRTHRYPTETAEQRRKRFRQMKEQEEELNKWVFIGRLNSRTTDNLMSDFRVEDELKMLLSLDWGNISLME